MNIKVAIELYYIFSKILKFNFNALFILQGFQTAQGLLAGLLNRNLDTGNFSLTLIIHYTQV